MQTLVVFAPVNPLAAMSFSPREWINDVEGETNVGMGSDIVLFAIGVFLAFALNVTVDWIDIEQLNLSYRTH